MGQVRIEARIVGVLIQQRDKSNPDARPGKDGTQQRINWPIPVMVLDESEVMRRVILSNEILSSGENVAPTGFPMPVDIVIDEIQLNGYVTTGGVSTTAKFEYWKSSTPETKTVVNATESPITVDGNITKLITIDPITDYQFQVIVENAFGSMTSHTIVFNDGGSPS